MPELVVLLDKQIIKRFTIKGTTISVGRHAKSDIALPDRTISLHHARITVVRDDCFLEDLDSTNGTYVNRHLVEQHYLEDGDVIALGKYQIIFRTNQGVESQLHRLSIHPKLLESHYQAWLKVLDGRKTGYLIPITDERISLGNLKDGRFVIERNSSGDYILQTLGKDTPLTSRKLVPGEELRLGDALLQFCLKPTDANTNA